MRVCIVSDMPEALEPVLAQAGHEVETCLSTDMAVAVAEKHGSEVVVFCEDVAEAGGVKKEDALKALRRLCRVVLVASRDSRLVAPAAGLGVRDFVFTPASPAEVLYRVENEAGPEEAAAALSGVPLPGLSSDEVASIARKAGSEKGPVWSKLWRGVLKTAGPVGPTQASGPEAREEKQAVEDLGAALGRPAWLPNVKLPRLPRVSFSLGFGKAGREKVGPGGGDTSPAARNAGEEAAQGRTPAAPGFSPKALAAVWSPSGFMVSFTALNLAVAAARTGYDVALLNFNLACPETDVWFGVRQTKPAACRVEDAGLMTFAGSLTVELAMRMLKERLWGVKYLPAGNKLGNIGTPDFGEGAVDLFREIIATAHARKDDGAKLTVVEAGSWFEQPSAFAALSSCQVLVVPLVGGPQEKAVLDMHLEELGRLGVRPEVVRFYPLEAGGASFRQGKKPFALDLDGDISAWTGLLVNVIEKGN